MPDADPPPVTLRVTWRVDRCYRSATPAERDRARCKAALGPGLVCNRRGVVAAANYGTSRRPAWRPVCAACLGRDRRVFDAVVCRRTVEPIVH